jgi:hypothetical protein
MAIHVVAILALCHIAIAHHHSIWPIPKSVECLPTNVSQFAATTVVM